MSARLWVILLLFFTLWPVRGAAEICNEPDSSAPIPDIKLQEVADGFDKPLHITHAGDGGGRLFVVEQGGRVYIIENGTVLPVPFLDIRKRVNSGGEKGLLSIAFHPEYRKNGFFYVNYTRGRVTLETVISRFRISAQNRADPESEMIVLRVKQPFANHNGGQIKFGPDGYLYIGMGDGGLANDPFGHGQDTTTLLGALLRIDVDRQAAGKRYAIPEDNPFRGKRKIRDEIWAYGLRNPWRFSFDAQDGRLFLADVGQDRIEEIDVITRGGNYGWAIMEGDRCVGNNNRCNRAGLELPVFTYPHPEGFSVTGGYVYRGNQVQGLCGVYLFADYVSGAISGLRVNDGRVSVHKLLLETDYRISSFGQDQSLEIYMTAHKTGKILKIIAPDIRSDRP